jgi:pimeloyl-ACP methyl ester carboxylesterase
MVMTAPSRVIGEGQNYGVKVLHDGGNGACVDIVFVHGLTGNAYNTWLHKETGIYWPSELLGQDIPNSRILSFGYDADVVHILGGGPASNSRLSNHAESLVGKLVRERERSETETRKIIFVAHSLGGLVTEQALIHSKNSAEQHLNQVERYTIGIVFLGVPHCGSDLEAWATVGRRMVSILKRTNKDILGVLNPDSETLHIVENNFHTNLRQRTDDPIKIVGFYEELAMKGIGEVTTPTLLQITPFDI